MNKILLIIQREYLSRVKKKSFLIMTFLVPLLFIGMMVLVVFLAMKGDELSGVKKYEVIDKSGLFVNKLTNSPTASYTYADESYEQGWSHLSSSGYDYLIYIPSAADTIQLIGKSKPGPLTVATVQSELSDIAESHRLIADGIDPDKVAAARKQLIVQDKQAGEKGVTDAQTFAAYAVGFLAAFLIYMSLFIYGVQVMRGVIEEKVSRIIEVIISSVKPFQLMVGKIVGVGMVGLTQFILWIVFSLVLSTAVGGVFMNKLAPPAAQEASNPPAAVSQSPAESHSKLSAFLVKLKSLNAGEIVLCFLFYFLTGYFLYSAIFAAVGSAVDNETETQQFMLPVTLPLVFTFILSMNFVINNPDSPLSVWLSMIPFTSPIAMMIRIPFGVPLPQIIASMALMIAGFLFTTWVAARIYRVGILMYGKKASYKELAKWFMYKE
jgi:ABC-2 type transport system permease protein